jgi:peptidoglycan hydrolase-like protein with peptidoglycan-binding domain
MEKNILNEIESMKYLLGYKRGVVISEQTTVSGNDLENIPDETPVANTGTPTANTSTETPVANTSTETPATTIKMGVENPRVKYLQQLLNQKFQSGLVDDGKYGPNTAAAILKNIEAIKQMKLNPVSTLGNEVKTVVQQPAAAPVEAPIQK